MSNASSPVDEAHVPDTPSATFDVVKLPFLAISSVPLAFIPTLTIFTLPRTFLFRFPPQTEEALLGYALLPSSASTTTEYARDVFAQPHTARQIAGSRLTESQAAQIPYDSRHRDVRFAPGSVARVSLSEELLQRYTGHHTVVVQVSRLKPYFALPCEGNRRDKVRKYLRSSLKKLQMPFVDLYLVHFPVYERAFKKSHRHHDAQRQRSDLPPVLDASPDSPTSEEESATAVDETDILDTWRGMEDAANMGMTRSIGLCNFNKEQVTRILTMATIRPAALQVECHAYLNQDDLLQFCKEHSICLTAYAPLGSPRAARHGAAASCKEEKPREEQNHSDLMQHELLRKIADTYKKTPAQILIRWLLQRGVVALPRATCPGHIQENIQVFDFELSEADVKILTGLNRNMRLYTYNIYGLPNRAEYPFK
nr:1,5-anhydro-D-fructose reductase-like [Dermacentor andersoni]